MKRSNLVLAAYLLAVFLSGGVVGFLAHHLYSMQSVNAKATTRGPDDYRHKYVEEMRSRLSLQEEQVQQLNAILDSTRLRYREFREKHRSETNAIQEEQVSKIRSMLSEPQRLQYETMRAEREKKRRKSDAPQRW
jgi:Spy/CpxP family protein refolding chaperone